MSAASTFNFNRAIVRAPSHSVVNGLSSTGIRPDFSGLAREHALYVKALEAAGLALEILQPLEDYPDAVFVEDAALVFSNVAVVLRPGAKSRAGEAAEILNAVTRRFDRVSQLPEGTVDGGDVLVTPQGVFIGRSERTNPLGASALTRSLAELGLRGLPVTTPQGVLHLKSDCSLLDEETILSTARLAASGVFDGFRVIIVPSEEGGAANAVRVNKHVLLNDAYPHTADLLAAAGYDVKVLPLQEVAKLDAGLSCMSLRWQA